MVYNAIFFLQSIIDYICEDWVCQVFQWLKITKVGKTGEQIVLYRS